MVALDLVYQKLREFGQPHLFTALAVLLAVPCGYQMYELNFVHYDDDAYPYVYAHTRRELLQMLDEIERISKRMGTDTDTGIVIVSPDYWPLPWYLRDYKKVNGLMFPYTLETAVQGFKPSHKMVIETVTVNPKLEDSLFAKPTPSAIPVSLGK